MKSKQVSQIRKIRFRRFLALSIALGLVGVCKPNAIAQQPTGDLPASPWNNLGHVTRATSVEPRQATAPETQLLRQPNRSSSAPTDAPLLIGPPSQQNQSATSAPSLSSSKASRREDTFQPQPELSQRPAAVTLLGPMAPKSFRAAQASSSNNRSIEPSSKAPFSLQQRVYSLDERFERSSDATDDDPSDREQLPLPEPHNNQSITAPRKHALTQKKQIEVQSDPRRMQAGGFNLESATPDRPEVYHDEPAPSPQVHVERRTTVHPTSSIRQYTPTPEPTGSQTDQQPTTRTSVNAYDESAMRRSTVATRVSYELLSNNFTSGGAAPAALEAPPGWSAVEQEIRSRLEKCDALLKRGAIMSARDEAVQGMRRLVNTMDAHRGFSHSAPALEEAFTALKEEADFQSMHGGGSPELIDSYVGSHSTKALKGRPLDGVNSDIASQHYRNYARYQFVVAADRHPWTSDLLYAYGKTLEKEAELDPERNIALRNQSVVCYQAAIQIAPSQSDASNQLGYALIHLDRIEEAYGALASSIQQKPTASAWSNLAEVYRRRGSVAEADYAIQQATAVSTRSPSYSYENPQVTEVDPSTFAKYSPLPMLSSGQSPQPAVAPAQANAKPSKTNFFTKIFK